MSDRTVDQVLAGCVRYWESTGVPTDAVAEMRTELQTHLEAAVEAGKDVDAVVGPDLDAFAEEWAAIHRGEPKRPAITTDRRGSSGSTWIWLTMGILAIAFALIAVLAPKGETMDGDQWQWLWVGAAVLLGIGELLTAGFFLLPFAVGAVVLSAN